MTPFELVNTINKEISAYTPKLSAAINKALLYHGNSSSIIAAGSENNSMSIEESEIVRVQKDQAPLVMMKVMDAANLLEAHSSWTLIADTRSANKEGDMELRYTLIRSQGLV